MLYHTILIYHITIPLIGYSQYDLYKASPWPRPQTTVNGLMVYAYIWPNSPFFALSRSNDAYINIRPEALLRCKQARALCICQNTEPEQKVTEQVTCAIIIATGLRISDLATCDVRVVKLKTTLWARMSSTNWMLSTKKKDKLKVTCPRAAEKVIII